MTVKELLQRARECQTCGKEHKPHTGPACPNLAPQWDSNGHAYRPRIQRNVIAHLEELAAS
jgi:hypothetical protein